MNLRDFVAALEEKRLLLRVRRPVDTDLEISSVVKLLKGRPVLFEKVRGHSMPVVSNVCSSREMVCQALGTTRAALNWRLAEAIEHPMEPARVAATDYQELPADLSRLPILRYYPRDGGRYIASGVAVARDPQYGINVSFHRAMVLDASRMALRIVERHLFQYLQRGLKEFAYCIGNPTTVLIAGAMSVELGKSELAIANALDRTEVIELGGHLAPQSEIVLICEVTGELADEGPFLDLTETFDIVRRQPVVRVKKCFARRDPIFHALLPGDLEHKTLMGLPREPTIFREVSKVCECLDAYLGPGGCSWLHGIVKIRKRHDDDGRKAIEAAFRGHASMKHVFVVDDDIDVEDPAAVEWALATRFQGDRDLVLRPREKGSSLDPSSDMATGMTTKVGFDLTAPLESSGKDFLRPGLPMKIDLKDYLE